MIIHGFFSCIGELSKYLWPNDFEEGSQGWFYWRTEVTKIWREIRNEIQHNPFDALFKPKECFPFLERRCTLEQAVVTYIENLNDVELYLKDIKQN